MNESENYTSIESKIEALEKQVRELKKEIKKETSGPVDLDIERLSEKKPAPGPVDLDIERLSEKRPTPGPVDLDIERLSDKRPAPGPVDLDIERLSEKNKKSDLSKEGLTPIEKEALKEITMLRAEKLIKESKGSKREKVKNKRENIIRIKTKQIKNFVSILLIGGLLYAGTTDKINATGMQRKTNPSLLNIGIEYVTENIQNLGIDKEDEIEIQTNEVQNNMGQPVEEKVVQKEETEKNLDEMFEAPDEPEIEEEIILEPQEEDNPVQLESIPQATLQEEKTTQNIQENIENQDEIEQNLEKEKRIEVLEAYLQQYVGKEGHKSPLIGYERKIVEVADKYEIDEKLFLAIARKESSMGTDGGPGITGRPFRPYNAWGLMTSHQFTSWEHGISELGRILSEGYFKQGLDTPQKIAPKYCPPTSDNWAREVTMFIEEIERFAENLENGQN